MNEHTQHKNTNKPNLSNVHRFSELRGKDRSALGSLLSLSLILVVFCDVALSKEKNVGE